MSKACVMKCNHKSLARFQNTTGRQFQFSYVYSSVGKLNTLEYLLEAILDAVP